MITKGIAVKEALFVVFICLFSHVPRTDEKKIDRERKEKNYSRGWVRENKESLKSLLLPGIRQRGHTHGHTHTCV